jgi:uncharacterized membrane protein
MILYGAAYFATLAVFVLADMVWLGTMASRLYRPTLGEIALSGVNLPPAFAFYILYPVGLVVFAILPALKGGSIFMTLFYGALFGFFTYATYDLTNQATLRNWTFQLTLLDVAWGSALAASAAAAGYAVASRIN